MHAETLAYMLHQLPLDMKMQDQVRQPDSSHLAGPPVIHRAVAIPAGRVTLGLARNSETFGWDNEYEAHTVEVPAFEIDRYKVTNRQYLEFMAAGGYETRAFWNDDDWNWKTAQGISHPLFWKKDGDRWLWRAMFDEVPLAARLARLCEPRGSQRLRALGREVASHGSGMAARRLRHSRAETTRPYPWGSQPPDSKFGNFDFHRWDPVPVNAFPRARVLSASTTCWAMDGNGPPPFSARFPVSSHFRFTADTPLISSMASISS